MASHNNTGKKGETLAIPFLKDRGFTILHCNWRYSHYEVDIIATRKEFLHFIEVKTRRSDFFGFPEESVDEHKIEHLTTAAEEYLEQNPGWKWISFDVLSILINSNGKTEFFFIEDVYF